MARMPRRKLRNMTRMERMERMARMMRYVQLLHSFLTATDISLAARRPDSRPRRRRCRRPAALSLNTSQRDPAPQHIFSSRSRPLKITLAAGSFPVTTSAVGYHRTTRRYSEGARCPATGGYRVEEEPGKHTEQSRERASN